MAIISGNQTDTRKLFLEHNIFIVWKPEFNLGIPIIDEHHRGIVTIINSLYFGMQNKYEKDILSPIIEMMHDYTRIHFQIEEDFLKKIDFPNAKKHHDLHLELTSSLRKLGRESVMGKDSLQFLTFLKQWWINHICSEDLHYKEHFFKK